MAKNVWQDDAYEYSGQTLHYCVKMNGTKIYDGIATARDFPIRIYLNRIAQGYLQSTFPQETGVTVDSGASACFTLVEKSFDGADWVEGNVLYCAYYIDAWGAKNGEEMAHPINGHADLRQLLFYTANIDYDCFPVSPDTGSTTGSTSGSSQSGSIIVSAASVSGCNWRKLPPLSEHQAFLMGISRLKVGSNNVNYYLRYNGEYYWVYGVRRLVKYAYSPAYPTVYKCE